ncbi:hypothetical protein ACLB2K_049490 [Fragaria x ananassa]
MASDYVSAPELPEGKEDGNMMTSFLGDCEEVISTLPKVKAWGRDDTYYFNHQGFWYLLMFLKGIIWAQQSFRARDTDIFLASSPKCGTTWLKALMSAIQVRNQSQSHHPLLTNNPHDCVPYLELHVHKNNPTAYLESLPSPRLLATHSSYASLPDSILKTSGTRIVYIARNPKDVLVSLWKFSQNVRQQAVSNGQLLSPLPIEEAFELFCKGESLAGPFWDHVLGYWEASKEIPDKVLFLKYEDMKKDTEGCVKRLAEFMRYPFSLEEERQGVVQEVINLCSLENLSNLEVNKSGVSVSLKVDNSHFFRKGQVGDSSNYLTPDMLQRLEEITEHKLGSAGLKF